MHTSSVTKKRHSDIYPKEMKAYMRKMQYENIHAIFTKARLKKTVQMSINNGLTVV